MSTLPFLHLSLSPPLFLLSISDFPFEYIFVPSQLDMYLLAYLSYYEYKIVIAFRVSFVGLTIHVGLM